MLRVCPKCQSNLSSHENYFCSNCGAELPKELVTLDASFKAVTYVQSASDKKPFYKEFASFMMKKLSPIPVGVLALGGVSIAVFIYGLYMQLRKPSVVPSVSPPINEKALLVTESIDKDVEEANLIEPEFAEYVPYDIDVFIEVNDFALIEDIYTTLDPYYSDFIQDLKPLVTSHVAIYMSDLSTAPSTTLIFEAKKSADDKSKAAYVDFDKYPWMSYEVYDGFVVISSKVRNVINSKSAHDGLIKNLKHHPKYTIMTSSKIDDGGTVLLFMNYEGEAFVNNVINNLDSQKHSKLQQKMSESSGNFVVM